MVSSGLVELDVQELVVTVGDKEGTTFQEAVTANRSSSSHESKDIVIGHHFPHANPGKEATALRITL